ncbi:MAG TPA: acyl carrier protein [Candidatus Ozemobacteraceae bacterium]|nr:acyl carrier protein [Candidatus Ozemobacteraceae bacterium]HQG28510.1 acyl carrier protein [Candidatus Ozemobacteraceae bacterium]
MKRPDITREELVALITETLFDVARIKVAPHQYEENLFALGLDSLKAIQMLNQLEDRLDLMIDDSKLKTFTSIKAMTDFFDSLPTD